MDLTIYHCFLPHTDFEASLAFYRDALGFEMRNDVEYGGVHWVTLGPPNQPGTSIVLTPPAGGDPGVAEDELRVVREMMAKGTFAGVNLATPDVDKAFAEIESKGVDIAQEPTDQPWGVRDCALRDPDGNMVRIFEVPDEG